MSKYVRSLNAKCKLTGQDGQEKNINRPTLSFTWKTLRIKMTYVLVEEESFILMNFNDLTDKIKLHTLKEVDKFKNLIISTLSHELLTPLTIISSSCDSIQDSIKLKRDDIYETTEPELFSGTNLNLENSTKLRDDIQL